MAFQSILFLAAVFILIVVCSLLFLTNVYWEKLFDHKNNFKTLIDSSKHVSKITEKFKTTRLYKALLQSLDLEICEVSHFQSIGDEYATFSEFSNAIRDAGLESSNIIIGVDFTASNEFQGNKSFDRKCLHTISKKKLNPYQQVISILSTVLEPFDSDNLIPAYGFGDVSTKDHSVFSFNVYKHDIPCKGLSDVLSRYEDIVKTVNLSGPTSFVPLIKKAIEITAIDMTYNILLIIADGQVEAKEDEATRKVIIEASFYPLSIIVIGVGDGPWDLMQHYDEKLPTRQFDNFQFVDYFQCVQSSNKSPDMFFALNALMEIPEQYSAIKKLGLIHENPERTKKTTLKEDLNTISKSTSLSSKLSAADGSAHTQFRRISHLPGMQLKKIV